MASDREVLFELRRVGYEYFHRFVALRDVSFQVFRGEKLAVVGANGCGKSTLLKILDGLLLPTAGAVVAFGVPLTDQNLRDEQFSPAFRQRVGFVFQNPDAQLFNPTVWDEIAFGPLQMDLPKGEIKRRVQDVITMLGLAELAERPPYNLSGGEKKKVAIAAVLSIGPEVLLLDEPTAGLDPRTQRWFVELLAALNSAGKTVLSALHDLSVVEEIADRVLVLSEDHRLVAEGTPQEILADRELLLGVNLIHERSPHARRGLAAAQATLSLNR